MFITLSKKGNHLVFIEKTFVDGLEVAGSVKVGVLELQDPTKAEAVLTKARTAKWKMITGEKPEDLCQVVKA